MRPDFTGSKNPNYKDGRASGVRNCKTCSIKISFHSKSGQCRSCNAKERMSIPSNNSNYKGGLKVNPYYCIDCGGKIGYYAWKDGTKRCVKCHHKIVKKEGRLLGRNNPMYGKTGNLCIHWKGGKSFEPYLPNFSNSLKHNIRNKYNNTCQICGKKDSKIKLDVHHIDYNKSNCKEINLIPLCHSCHARTNFNRVKWENMLYILVQQIV